MIAKAVAWTSLALGIVTATVLSARPDFRSRRIGKADEGYLTSRDCLACHADHYASWARTHHSRMTQEARPESVQGDFQDKNTFEYLGIKARMEKRGSNFWMALEFPDGAHKDFAIERTVGSRRVEQYLTKFPGRYERLPLAYDLVNRRWMSLNGSFFYPDGTNYFQHQSLWDANCVFCHNVKAQPHYSSATRTFATEVTELGIACGACHGQGAAHAQAALSPFTRTSWRVSERKPRQIVNPLKIDSDRALMVCGHCHGQRLPRPIERIDEIVGRGDPFNAGDDLRNAYEPISRESKVGNVSFAGRFWANGSPRLTAYEYQGILRSKCFQKGTPGHRLNCLNCHVMHAGDPKGQIMTENRGNHACLQCHSKYETKAALVGHTGHSAESTGSRCYDCHMPRVVYGIMSVHPTHEITVPDPMLTISQGVPNACNQCHLDKSVNWSITQARRLWTARFASAQTSSDTRFDLPEGPRALFAEDALCRALVAEALGAFESGTNRQWAKPYLIEAFEDNYPIVRFFAANGLAHSGTQGPRLDYLADASSRQTALEQWRNQLPAAPQESAAVMAARLRSQRHEVDLEVGE